MGTGIIIHRRCACGCGQVTGLGKKWISGHNSHLLKKYKHSKNTRLKMSLAHEGLKHSKKTRLKMSLARKGYRPSEETKIKIALSHFKSHPNDEYCDVWRDRQYRKDLRKDYCENTDCKGKTKKLTNHHINLNKKDCKPFNVMTLCRSCHRKLHLKLGIDKDHKEYLTIIRTDKITYIHKKDRNKIVFKRII